MPDTGAGPIALHLDKKKCAASRTCVGIAPALFEYRPDLGASRVREEIVDDGEQIALAREAQELCPTQAIKVLE